MSLAEHSSMHRRGNLDGTPRKLTDEQVLYIREHYIPRDKDFGTRPLGKRFGVDHKTISRIVRGEYYKNLI